MTAKIVVDKVLNEIRLYRQLLEEELPVYLGTTFWIEEDNSGKYWLYVMTLSEINIYEQACVVCGSKQREGEE